MPPFCAPAESTHPGTVEMKPDQDLRSLRRVLQATSYLMLAEAAKPVISFLLILLISRQLGRQGMGSYSIVLSITALFELIATAGLPQLLVRDIAANRASVRHYASGAMGVCFLGSAVIIPVMLVTLRLLNYPPEIAAEIKMLTWTMPLMTVQQYAIAVCEGLQNMKLRAFVSTLDTIGRLVTGAVMIVLGYGVYGVVEGMVLTRIVATAIAV